ncbi:MAG: hypothetical protein OSJ56_09745 [Prevotella sp.]|nr:hypothetical protein [Prevotella sp.]
MSLFTIVRSGRTGAAIQEKIDRKVESVNNQAVSRGTQAVNALRNAELEVLKGQRSGRVYRKPHSKASYTASAPGEPPARRTGNLRLHWNGKVIKERTSGGGLNITAELESQEPYAGILEHGSRRMAPRPFLERIKQKAMPKIKRIYSRPYT